MSQHLIRRLEEVEWGVMVGRELDDAAWENRIRQSGSS